ncbi:MAG: hypothetical protein ACOCRO_09795 [Halanaerobiales bacterium]
MVKTKVTPKGVQVLLYSIAVFIMVDILAKFDIIDITDTISPLLIPVTASLFIFMEIGLMQFIKGRKDLDYLQWFGLTVAIVTLVSVLLGVLGIEVQQLSTLQGFTNSALLIYVLIELFKAK